MDRPVWITLPAATFTMGSDPRDAAPPFANERPQQLLDLPPFQISRVPITNAQYARFVAATGYPAPGHWADGQPPVERADFPVTYVTWADAQAFCAWASVRLPTEAEWEKAARGPAVSPANERAEAARWWPWGNDLPDSTRAHFNGQAQGVAPAAQSVMAVGQLPRGASAFGVLDLAGNVWEWTNSHYRPYPYRADDGREDGVVAGVRVVRGGSYNHDLRQIRCAARDGMAAGVRDVYISFRVATDGERGATARLDLDWVTIPAGPFWLGSSRSVPLRAVLPSEMPQHRVTLAAFRMAQTPVTNEEYGAFVQATGYVAPAHWLAGVVPRGFERHPVTHVDWHDAQAYCAWAGVRLPTEAEWERAAAGADSGAGTRPRAYPWGDAPPDATRLNFRRSSKHATTTPVDRYPRGATPDGFLDLAGNVWEWTSTHYAAYPYAATDGREVLVGGGQRVLRGGSFVSPCAAYVRCAMRSLSFATRRREHIGFRVVQR